MAIPALARRLMEMFRSHLAIWLVLRRKENLGMEVSQSLTYIQSFKPKD